MGSLPISILPSVSTALGAALLGLGLGFAVNRIVQRWAYDKTLLGGIGRCGECGRWLPWHAWLPGWELRGPKAVPGCGHPLPRWRLPNLLVLTVGSAGLAFLHPGEPWSAPVSALLLLYLLYPLAAIDMLALVVETRLVVLGIGLRFAGLAWLEDSLLVEMIGGMLMGAGLFTMVEVCYRTLRGRAGLGDGDAAVMGLIGAFVGWRGVLPVVALAGIGGLAVGLPAVLLGRRSLAAPIPFVPFLAVAGMGVFLAQTVWPEHWARLMLAAGTAF